MKVIILAAGKGTRMEGLSKNKSKCSIVIDDTHQMTSLSRLINQTCRYIREAEIFVVTGYGHESVIDSITKTFGRSRVNFIYNPFYEDRGCNYSLSCAYPVIQEGDCALIFEGDSVYEDSVIARLNLSIDECASLVRPPCSHLSENGVYALSDKFSSNRIFRYVYDKNHNKDFIKTLSDIEGVEFCDSLQAWFISKNYSENFRSALRNYFNSANSDDVRIDRKESGIFTINQLISKGVPFIKVQTTDFYRNLNTKEDVKAVKSFIKQERKHETL